MYRKLDGPRRPVWTGAENLIPKGIRSLDRPVRRKAYPNGQFVYHKISRGLTCDFLFFLHFLSCSVFVLFLYLFLCLDCPCFRRNSNPQSQQTSGHRPVPYSVWPPGSAGSNPGFCDERPTNNNLNYCTDLWKLEWAKTMLVAS